MVQSVSFPFSLAIHPCSRQPAAGNVARSGQCSARHRSRLYGRLLRFTVYGLRYTTFTVQWVFSQHAVTLSIAARSCDANYCCTMSHPRRLRKSQKENKNRFGDPLIDVRSSYISILVAFGRDYIKYDSWIWLFS